MRRSGRVGATLAAGVVAAWGSGLTAQDLHPAWSPTGEWVAFDSDREGRRHVYVVRPDGSGLTRVTGGDEGGSHASWSPDGRRLVFESDRGGAFRLWTVAVSGGETERLTDGPGNDLLGAWSPDGAAVAFQSDRDGSADIYVLELDGGAVRRLTEHPAYDGVPRWSRSGDRVLFDSERSGERAIWLAPADGDGPVQPLLRDDVRNHVGAWSPVDDRVAFTMPVGEDPGELHVFDPATGSVAVVAGGEGWQGAATWSPDGSRLLYQSNATGEWRLRLLDLASGRERPFPR